MKRQLTTLFITLLATLAARADYPAFRTFTNNQGRQIIATLVSSNGTQVVLRTPDGKQHTLPVSSLSRADQMFLRNQAPGGGGGPMPGSPPRGGAGFPPMPVPRGPAPGPAPMPTPASAPSPSASSTASSGSNYGGMALAPDWMPQRTETKRELMRSLAFYAQAVLRDTAPGKEPVPSQLGGGFSWLMPVDQAIARLPRGAFKLGERKVDYTCFPANSLMLLSYGGNFKDRERSFNVLHLLLDARLRVVSVEFVEQTPKKGFIYEVEGSMEPYYNFLTLTNNASTKREVVYDLETTSPGVMLVQTFFRERILGGGGALMPGMPQMPGMPGAGPGMRPGVANMPENPSVIHGKLYEYVHWYLPAPLARCLLQIAQKNGVQAQ